MASLYWIRTWGKGRDYRVPMRVAYDQMICLKSPEGFAQGRDGDTQGSRELYVVNPAARL